jgi:hypothetical protein
MMHKHTYMVWCKKIEKKKSRKTERSKRKNPERLKYRKIYIIQNVEMRVKVAHSAVIDSRKWPKWKMSKIKVWKTEMTVICKWKRVGESVRCGIVRRWVRVKKKDERERSLFSEILDFFKALSSNIWVIFVFDICIFGIFHFRYFIFGIFIFDILFSRFLLFDILCFEIFFRLFFFRSYFFSIFLQQFIAIYQYEHQYNS